MDGSSPELSALRTSVPKIFGSSCDTCKRKKIKCERQGDSCKHCAARNLECTMTEKKRKPRARKPNVVTSIEDRIERIEALVNAVSNKSQRTTKSNDDARSMAYKIGNQAPLCDMLSKLTVTDKGGSRFVGAASGFSLFSPRGMQWVTEKIGSRDAERLTSVISGLHQPLQEFSMHILEPVPAHLQQTLPVKAIADVYVNTYFNTFNRTFPLYNEAAFNELMTRHYSGTNNLGAAWYASLNIVIALGSVVLVEQERTQVPPSFLNPTDDDLELSWRYFGNAISQLLELQLRPGDMMAVQAITAMAFMLQITSESQATYILSSIAARLAYAIGLHRQLDGSGLSPAEMKQRQLVFWIIFVLDNGITLRLGRPSAMNNQDIGVSLPEVSPIDGNNNAGLLRVMAELALLEGRVNSELYSAQARALSSLERLKVVSCLDTELTEWRDSLPLEIRPENEITCDETQHMQVVMMHFSYYNCLSAIHRASVHHGSWTSEPGHDSNQVSKLSPRDYRLNPRIYLSGSICLAASRSVICLLRYFDDETSGRGIKHNLAWMASYYPLSAALTLFANILQTPGALEASSDVGLMNFVVNFLSRSTAYRKYFHSVLEIFTELIRVATLVVDRTQTQNFESSDRLHTLSSEISERDRYTADAGGMKESQYFPPGPSEVGNGQMNSDTGKISICKSLPPISAYASNAMACEPTVLHDELSGASDPYLSFPGLSTQVNSGIASDDIWFPPVTTEWDLAYFWNTNR